MLNTQLFLMTIVMVGVVSTHRLPLLEDVVEQDQDAAEAAEAALEGVEEDGVDLATLERFRQQGSVASEHKHSGGCSGGCSGTRGGASRRASPRTDEYQGDRPRPIFGLLSNILETARIGYRLDSPHAHLLY